MMSPYSARNPEPSVNLHDGLFNRCRDHLSRLTKAVRKTLYVLTVLFTVTAPFPLLAEQASGPDIPEVRPVLRPGFIGVRERALLPDLISVFNQNFDRVTSEVTRRGGAQRVFCDDQAEGLSPSVMILSIYENGAFHQGSGTVIQGSGPDGDADRVLTASHVVPPIHIGSDGVRSPLSRVIAFGSDGHALADLSPVIAGDIHALNRVNDPDLIFDDAAVLEVMRFLTVGAEADWAEMGAPLSPAQPERLMALFQPSGSVALNPGMSGAGVLDVFGSVIGVMSYNIFLSTDPYLDRPETGYEAQVLSGNAGDGAAAWSPGLQRVTETVGQRLRRDNVGYALPVRHAEVLEALGAHSEPGPLSPDGDAAVAGYPLLACLSVDLRRLGSDLPLASSSLRDVANFDTFLAVAGLDAETEKNEVTYE